MKTEETLSDKLKKLYNHGAHCRCPIQISKSAQQQIDNLLKEAVKKLKEEIDNWKKDVLDTEKNQDRKYTDGALIAISTIQDKIDEVFGDN